MTVEIPRFLTDTQADLVRETEPKRMEKLDEDELVDEVEADKAAIGLSVPMDPSGSAPALAIGVRMTRSSSSVGASSSLSEIASRYTRGDATPSRYACRTSSTRLGFTRIAEASYQQQSRSSWSSAAGFRSCW